MNYKIIVTHNFEKQLKKLVKKFPSIIPDLEQLENRLVKQPNLGVRIGKNAYKIRLSVKSKRRGKSGGMRVITYLELDLFIDELTNIYLLSIYDKSETQTITAFDLKRLIERAVQLPPF